MSSIIKMLYWNEVNIIVHKMVHMFSIKVIILIAENYRNVLVSSICKTTNVLTLLTTCVII